MFRRFKLIISIILLIIIFISFPVKANTINDCTNKIYNKSYNSLSQYEKQQLSIFDINIINEMIKDKFKDKDKLTMGFIDYNTKTIYVSNNKSNSSNADKIFYHEIGHSINYVFVKKTSQAIYNDKVEYFDSSHWEYEYYSKSQEFIDIFKEEKHDIYLYSDEKYFLTDSSEYFAECVAIYHQKPDKLKRLAPGTYEFLDKVINQKV